MVADKDLFQFEGIWVFIHALVTLCLLRWFWCSLRGPASSVPGANAAGSIPASPLLSAAPRPRPPINYLDPVALTRGLGGEEPTLYRGPHSFSMVRGASPSFSPASDLRKPVLWLKDTGRSPATRAYYPGRWETDLASAIPRKPVAADGNEHAGSLEALSAALRKPTISGGPLSLSQGFLDATTPKPTTFRLRPSNREPYQPLKFTNVDDFLPSLTRGRRPTVNGPLRLWSRPQPRFQERFAAPAPLISLATDNQRAVPPKQRWFS